MFKQKQIAKSLLNVKFVYKNTLCKERSVRREIRQYKRKIAQTPYHPFLKHSHSFWQERIDFLEGWVSGLQPLMHETQEQIVELIHAFDACGQASIHEYAALLSTSQVHVQRAMNGGAKNLMKMVIRQTENGANKSNCINSEVCVLHDAVTEVLIRAVEDNEHMRETAENMLQKMPLKTTGRPLSQYQIATAPNGKRVVKTISSNLTIAQ